MSGIAAIYNLNGRPLDRALLRRITDVIAHRGPDGGGLFVDGAVGLSHQMLRTTPESLHEEQPLADETGNLILTLDGRVDNRDELKAALKAKGLELRADTDAELVLRAYQAWGEECPQRIIGDFAFVVWDKRNRHFFCARDPMGIRPFYYYLDDRTFLCGSELRQILEHPTVRREPNEGMVGEYLSAVIVDTEETLYRGVFRLPGGHALLIQPGRVRKYRYWNVEPRELRYRTDEQYAEHFLEIFREAVRCRLRGLGPIGADLSGGLDSSSIVCVAQSLYRAGQSPGQGLETFSMVLSGSLSDESAYIDDVDRMWNLTTNRLSPILPEAACYTEAIGRSFDFPDYPNCVDGNALRALARARGVRVNLTGQGGDERLNRSSYHYADLLRRLRIPSLIQEAWSDASRIGPTAAIAKVLSAGLVPLLPERARHGIRRLRGGNEKFFPWVDPHFARRIDLLERIHARPSGPTFTSLARQDVYNAAVHGTSVHVSEVEERLDSWLGLEGRHPFQDQRIVEFAVQLPESQRWRHGQQRFVLRQALRGLLPESIRQRTTKGDFNHTFEDAFRILGGSARFESLAVEATGWVDGGRVRRMIQELQSNACIVGKKECISHNYPLWMVLGVDVWYKTMFLEPGCDQRGFAVLGT